MRIRILLFIIITYTFSPGISQSVTGVPGYMRIPTAQFLPDGNFYFGSSFLPKKYLSYSDFKKDAFAVYASITFLPFLELDFRVTRILNVPAGTTYTVDRMPSARLRLFKEKKARPSIAIGAHDFISHLDDGTVRNFGATYIVATKGIYFPNILLKTEISLGYGGNWLSSKHNEFIGLFGGISLNWLKIKWLNLLSDYDGNTINTGLNIICFNHLSITAGSMNFDAFTGSINYHFNLEKKY